jgi:hypothetical protein
MNLFGPSTDTGGVQFWNNPERAGWLEKQGASDIVTWGSHTDITQLRCKIEMSELVLSMCPIADFVLT